MAPMAPDDPPVDEARRRAFEADRADGGSAPVETFVPPPGNPARDGTLEELIAIDLEFRWRRRAEDADTTGPEPSPADYDALLATAGDPALRARLVAANDALRDEHSATPALRPGLRIGRYVLEARAGRGAFAEVWRARDDSLGRAVAVKLLHAGLAGDAAVRARFEREARSAAALRHPSILTVHEVGAAGSQPFLVAEFASGGTLADAVRAERPAPRDAARVAMRLAEALDYAHACGVIHRDVKPANVLLDAAGGGEPRVLLADFGLAAVREGDVTLTRAGEILGTPGYMAPEQVAPSLGAADARTDVYGLGALLHHLLDGEPPFAGRSVASVLHAVLHEEPAPPRDPHAPRDLAQIAAKALAKEPRDRYATAREMAEDLRRFLAGEPVAARPPGLVRLAVLWARRRPSLAAAIALGTIAFAASVAVGVANVAAERRRTESQLYRSLVAQTETLLAARGNDWHGRAQRALAEAAQCDVPERDLRALRDLALRSHGLALPSPRAEERWPAAGGEPVALAVSPDGARVVVASTPRQVVLRAARGGRVVASAETPEDPVAVAFAGGGVAVWLRDGSRVLLDRDSLATAVRAPLASALPLCAAVHAAAHAAGYADGTLEVSGGAASWTRAAHAGGTTAVAWSSDGALVASGGLDRTVAVWDAATGAAVARSPVSDPPRSLVFDAAGGTVAYGCWETSGWGTFPFRGTRDAYVRSGVHLAPVRWIGRDSADRVVTLSADGTLRLWGFDAAPLAATDPEPGPLATAAASPGGERFFVAAASGEIAVWRFDVPPGCGVFVTRHAARFVPGTRRLATCAGILDVGPGARVAGGESPHADAAQVWGVASSADGRRIVTTAHDGAVRIRDAATFEVVRTLRASGPLAWTAAFSPSGSHVAAACGDALVAFDAATGAELGTARHAGAVGAVAFHPAEPIVATGDATGAVRLWTAPGLRPATTLRDAGPAVHDVAFSPDGRDLAAACGDGAVLLWRGVGDSAPEPLRLGAGGGAAWAVAFDGTGRRLAAGTERGIVTLFEREDGAFVSVATLRSSSLRVRSLSFGTGEGAAFLAAGCYVGASAVWDLDVLRASLRESGLDWER